MPDTTTLLSAAAGPAADQQGPGDTLRIVLLASLVGAALLAWFLLRGYRNGDDHSGDNDPND
ncbi:hypothetical protein [Streptomyces sp. NPDC050504]|uniref:hypothetical protein n=1 Tax=Streptomyces sp. NPDC050504 TaxID=3365618 RepID=UPI0037A34962